MKPDKTGFTLVELVIVLIIIGVLSALVISMTSKIPAKAALEEAQAAMEVLRIQLKEYYFSHNSTYPWAAASGVEHNFTDDGVPALLNLKTGDLNGTRFIDGSYSIEIQDNVFWIYCHTPINNFFKQITDDHSGNGTFEMNSSGQIFQDNLSISGFQQQRD